MVVVGPEHSQDRVHLFLARLAGVAVLLQPVRDGLGLVDGVERVDNVGGARRKEGEDALARRAVSEKNDDKLKAGSHSSL